MESENWSAKQIVELYEIAVAKAEDVEVYSYIRMNYEKMIQDGKAHNKFSYLKKSLAEDYAKAYSQLKLNYTV